MGTQVLPPQDCLAAQRIIGLPPRLPFPRRRNGSDRLRAPEVTLLRRGQSLDSKVRSSSSDGGDDERRARSPAVGSSDVLYAGSAFAISPEPSALPLPSFSKKKKEVVAVDDSATRDLRRLLRLD